jgi:amino acid transporter
MKKKKAGTTTLSELVIYCMICLFAIVTIYQVRDVKASVALFPHVVSVCVLALGVFTLITLIRERNKQAKMPDDGDKGSETADEQPEQTKKASVPWWASLLLIGVYILLIYFFGFVLSSMAYTAIIPLATAGVNKRNVRTALIFAVAIGLVLVGFERVFYITLYQGLLPGLLRIYI